MAAKKPRIQIWGILLEPEEFPAEKGKPEHLIVHVRIAEGSPANPLFYSSPKLRDILEQYPVLKGIRCGMFGYTKQTEMEYTESIFPFHQLTPFFQEQLIGKGVGTELERKALTAARKIIGNITLKPYFNVWSPRIRQLTRRKIPLKRKIMPNGMPKIKYAVPLEQMRKAAARARQEHRKQFRLSPKERLKAWKARQKRPMP